MSYSSTTLETVKDDTSAKGEVTNSLCESNTTDLSSAVSWQSLRAMLPRLSSQMNERQ
jgi:hypothetical protein